MDDISVTFLGRIDMTKVAFRRGDKQGAMIGTIGVPVSEANRNQTVVLPRALLIFGI